MFVFRKIWRALFSCYLRLEIRPFALLPTTFSLIKLIGICLRRSYSIFCSGSLEKSLRGDTYVSESTSGLFKYMWPFSRHQALKEYG